MVDLFKLGRIQIRVTYEMVVMICNEPNMKWVVMIRKLLNLEHFSLPF